MKSRNQIYLFLYGVCGFVEVLTYSRYIDIIPGWIFTLVKVISSLILMFLYLSNLNPRKILLKYFLTSVSFIILGMVVYIRSSIGFNLILIIAFMLAYKYIRFDRLLKTCFISLIIGWIFVTLSSILGIIENRTYLRSSLDTVANTYGFNYYGYPTMLIFTCSIIFLRFKNTIKYTYLIMVLLVNYFASRVYTTRIYLYAIIIFLIWIVLTEKLKLIKLNKWFWNLMASIGFPTCYVINYLVYALYDSKNIYWYAINTFSTGRLRLGNLAISNYPIRLLGQKIIMYGNAERVYGNIGNVESNYIDSGYLYSVLGYGLIFSLVLALTYTIIFRFFCKEKDTFLYGWLLLFMVLNIANNYLLTIYINPLLLALIPAIYKDSFSIKCKGLFIHDKKEIGIH